MWRAQMPSPKGRFLIQNPSFRALLTEKLFFLETTRIDGVMSLGFIPLSQCACQNLAFFLSPHINVYGSI
jgi:hypothetical protein